MIKVRLTIKPFAVSDTIFRVRAHALHAFSTNDEVKIIKIQRKYNGQDYLCCRLRDNFCQWLRIEDFIN